MNQLLKLVLVGITGAVVGAASAVGVMRLSTRSKRSRNEKRRRTAAKPRTARRTPSVPPRPVRRLAPAVAEGSVRKVAAA